MFFRHYLFPLQNIQPAWVEDTVMEGDRGSQEAEDDSPGPVSLLLIEVRKYVSRVKLVRKIE